jgi:hypothetical protein
MIGFTKDVSETSLARQASQDDEEPRMGRITISSVVVLVAILGMAIVNQYLSQ